MDWSTVLHYIQCSSAIISIILNILLTILIVHESPKAFGTYKYLMIYVTVFEICYSILDVIVSPRVYSYGSICIAFVNLKNSSLDSTTLLFLLNIYCGLFGFSMGIFVIHFFYRYAVMTQSKYLDSLNDWRFIFWFLFPFLYGLFYGLMIYLFLSQTEEANEMIRDVILYDFDLNIDDIVFLGATIYQKNGSNSKLNWRPICGIAIIWVMIAISSFLMIYFGWSCYNTLQKPTLKSSNFHNLQKQVYYALLTETLIPVVLLHFPVSVLFLFTFYELDIQSISRIFSATIAIFPAVDPLPTMFIIQNYRDAIIRKLKLQKCLKGDQTATAIARHHPRSFQLKRIQTGTIQMVEIKY